VLPSDVQGLCYLTMWNGVHNVVDFSSGRPEENWTRMVGVALLLALLPVEASCLVRPFFISGNRKQFAPWSCTLKSLRAAPPWKPPVPAQERTLVYPYSCEVNSRVNPAIDALPALRLRGSLLRLVSGSRPVTTLGVVVPPLLPVLGVRGAKPRRLVGGLRDSGLGQLLGPFWLCRRRGGPPGAEAILG